jgi:hypothetical protein
MARASGVSLDGCSVHKLKALLGLGERPQHAGGTLPTRDAEATELARLLGDLCQGRGRSGDLLLASVCDAETTVDVLRGIKELAKELRSGAPSDAHRHAATVLYHAAIAAGVAHHGMNISSRAFEARVPLYEDLAAALAGEPLGALFRTALERPPSPAHLVR